MNKMLQAVLGVVVLALFTTSAHAQWMQTNWPTSKNYFKLYSGQNSVFARTWDSLNGGRTFVTSDSGSNWKQISSADSNIDILSLVMLNNKITAATWNGFYRANLGDTGWNAVTPTGIPADSAIWSVAMINAVLYAGAMGDIYKSADSGTTWTRADSGIPTNARITSFVSAGSTILRAVTPAAYLRPQTAEQTGPQSIPASQTCTLPSLRLWVPGYLQ